jgi:hypothetical protein
VSPTRPNTRSKLTLSLRGNRRSGVLDLRPGTGGFDSLLLQLPVSLLWEESPTCIYTTRGLSGAIPIFLRGEQATIYGN